MTPPVLRTERLVLRALRNSDADAATELLADPEVSRWLAVDPGAARIGVERRLSYQGPAGMGHWAILLDDTLVGLAHLRPSRELPGEVAEMGWHLAPAYWGQGLATEAAQAVLRHGFDTLGLPAVFALVHESNVGSLKLAQRLGFLDVGGGEHYGGPHRVHIALRP